MCGNVLFGTAIQPGNGAVRERHLLASLAPAKALAGFGHAGASYPRLMRSDFKGFAAHREGRHPSRLSLPRA